MSEPLVFNPNVRRVIQSAVGADSHMCWTCRSCLNECPVNLATSRLQPLKFVRLANLGLLDEMLDLPQIWYCLTCNRCSQVCPMQVKPAAIIGYARSRWVASGRVSQKTLDDYRMLLYRFQRVRWHAAKACMKKDATPDLADSLWREWMEKRVDKSLPAIRIGSAAFSVQPSRSASRNADGFSCFTCKECSNACPAFGGSEIFDPLAIIRMANLGMGESLLTSPSIWLCLECQRCTDTCSQRVRGHELVRHLRKLAIETGAVDKGFLTRWYLMGKGLYPKLLNEIDRLFGFQ